MFSVKNIHHASGLILLLFIVAHLFNHLMALSGPEIHIQTMQSLRQVYRHPLAEWLIFLAALSQVITGLKLVFTASSEPDSRWELWQRRSGLYLAFFLLIHLSAVLVGRWILQVDTNFWFGVQGLNRFPHVLFFGPYYSLAILAFFTHLACIHARKMKTTIMGLSSGTQAKTILFLGILMAFFVLWGATNGFTGYELPDSPDPGNTSVR